MLNPLPKIESNHKLSVMIYLHSSILMVNELTKYIFGLELRLHFLLILLMLLLLLLLLLFRGPVYGDGGVWKKK